jgi:hypothetical protein
MDSRDDGNYMNVASVTGQSRASLSQDSSIDDEELDDIKAESNPTGEESGLETEQDSKPTRSLNSAISKYDKRDFI